ncbi:Tetratricopeptide repeat-containing protein [Maribacter orientalis]|uniref:Tetratricopeptide repeat-containing protein n=1 Tax=Maribacter orientalis TaxID=228957 RepID=A0A1H7JHG7_9FLAO|nr:tetratricopeptide repeat protein [Maribacter orientalis]SEK73856.1 Tetratricopeptide repeat-containing protein [Maribacter orientalis]
MKYTKVSLLFQTILFSFFAISLPLVSIAQTPIDSSYYYYGAINNPVHPNDLPSGINFYIQKKITDLNSKDTLSAISDLRLLAIGEFKIGNNFNSENHIVEALNLIQSMSSKDTLIDAKVGLYNQLGRIYRASNNPSEAIKSYDNALQIARKFNDSVILLNNKANIYKDQLDYENALDIYNLIYQKQVYSNDKFQIALVLDNLGFVQSKLNLPSALQNILKALKFREETNNLVGLYSSNKHLAEYYLDRKDTAKALIYAEKVLSLANKINSSSLKLEGISLFMSMNKNPLIHEYKRLTDSISNTKQIAENKNAFLKYNIAEEQKKTQASQLLQEVEFRKRLVYQFLVLFVLMILIGSYFIYRNKYRKARIEEIYKTETRISKKVHDEVANDMYKVMTSLENNVGIDSKVIDEMEKIYAKTRDISRENSAIDFHQDFGIQLNDLLFGYKNNTVTVVTRNLSKINWEGVPELNKTAIYRVLQELMTNMRKHSNATSAALVFHKNGSKIQIDYRDNGIGCDLFKKNGLQHTESRITSLNGTIIFESKLGHGFKASIII